MGCGGDLKIFGTPLGYITTWHLKTDHPMGTWCYHVVTCEGTGIDPGDSTTAWAGCGFMVKQTTKEAGNDNYRADESD